MPDETQETDNPYESPITASVVEPAPVAQMSSFGTNAAKLSWQLPFAGIVVSIVLGILMPAQKAVFGAIVIILCLVGFVCGVVALVSVVRFGWRRILIPACIGLFLSGGVLAMLILAILAVRRASGP
ncbi:MAG: hypothetical protein ABR915_07745 [Thermoguttaceae bacterium]|jgi:hypothetical protein